MKTAQQGSKVNDRLINDNQVKIMDNTKHKAKKQPK